MRCPKCRALWLSLAMAACSKSPEQRVDDVAGCSAEFTTAAAITQCLRAQGGWSRAAAESAGSVRAIELERIALEVGVVAAIADSQHGQELRACDQVLVDLRACLITRYGWEDRLATAADDSVWASRSVEHERQIRSCLGRRGGAGTGACLQLYYKWLPRRALALDDSLRRARLR